MLALRDIELLHSIVLVCTSKDMFGHLIFVIANLYSFDSILLKPDIILCKYSARVSFSASVTP